MFLLRAIRKLWKNRPRRLIKHWVAGYKQEARVREHGMEILTAVESITRRQLVRVHWIGARIIARWYYAFVLKRLVSNWRTHHVLDVLAVARSLEARMSNHGLRQATRAVLAAEHKPRLRALIKYWQGYSNKDLQKLMAKNKVVIQKQP